MLYRAELEGFTGHFNTVADLKVWAEGLIARHSDMQGKICRIYKAAWVARDGSGASYIAKPTREVVVGA
jgi:hypothetical protein